MAWTKPSSGGVSSGVTDGSIVLDDLSNEVLQAMTGTTAINPVIPDKSIENTKLSDDITKIRNWYKVVALGSTIAPTTMYLKAIFDLNAITRNVGDTAVFSYTLKDNAASGITNMNIQPKSQDSSDPTNTTGTSWTGTGNVVYASPEKVYQKTLTVGGAERYLHVRIDLSVPNNTAQKDITLKDVQLVIGGQTLTCVPVGYSLKSGTITKTDHTDEQLVNYANLKTQFTNFEQVNIPIAIAKTAKLYGKKYNYLGDSLTQAPSYQTAKAYHAIIGEKYGMTVNNYGVSGTAIGTTNTTDSFVDRYQSMDATADGIVVFGGTNDFVKTPLGTMADRTKATTYGAMHLLLDGLQTMYPDKPIFFITPLNFTRDPSTLNNITTLKQYVDGIKEVCEYYSVPCLDLYRNGRMNSNNAAMQTLLFNSGDKIHLNTEGHKVLAEIVEGFLLSH